MRKLNSVNFLMQTDDSTKQAIFDSVCEQRIKAFRSSPTPGDSEDDPWADKTAEISFGGPAAGTGGEGAVRGEGDGEAVDSSDEECEAAPDKMEVDNDQDPWDTITAPTATGPVARLHRLRQGRQAGLTLELSLVEEVRGWRASC